MKRIRFGLAHRSSYLLVRALHRGRALRSLPDVTHLVALCRRIADTRAFEDAECFRDAGASGAGGEVFLGAQYRKLLGHRDVDKLVECHALRPPDGLVEKRRLKPQRKIAPLHDLFSGRLMAPVGGSCKLCAMGA